MQSVNKLRSTYYLYIADVHFLPKDVVASHLVANDRVVLKYRVVYNNPVRVTD